MFCKFFDFFKINKYITTYLCFCKKKINKYEQKKLSSYISSPLSSNNKYIKYIKCKNNDNDDNNKNLKNNYYYYHPQKKNNNKKITRKEKSSKIDEAIQKKGSIINNIIYYYKLNPNNKKKLIKISPYPLVIKDYLKKKNNLIRKNIVTKWVNDSFHETLIYDIYNKKMPVLFLDGDDKKDY